ncbi:hypothetical protein [Nocardia pseudovaccinii]|uniref:hypothetical protein n=1 Tax=Nocardia pseudovaccinii TaxID=189540 RepID=UPI0007A55CFF|nr:hypothetical protein [Nocardia pseudovaccinii]
MDHYEDKHLIVRTDGGPGSAAEMARQITEWNIENAVERLGSAIDAQAQTEKMRAQHLRIQTEQAEAQRLRQLRERAREAERAARAREREAHERETRGR